jgi:hypothetical protein
VAQIHPAIKPYVLLIENASGASIVQIRTVLYRFRATGCDKSCAFSYK